jgi:hypothetical protein
MGDNISVAPFKQTNKGSGWKIHHGLAPLRVERSDCDLASHIIDPVPHRNLEWGLVLAFAGSQLRYRVTVMPGDRCQCCWNGTFDPNRFPIENQACFRLKISAQKRLLRR